MHIAACSMTLELYGMDLSDLEPIVDEVTGVATFVEQARESEVTLFI
jgi:peroxiredoxin family protein